MCWSLSGARCVLLLEETVEPRELRLQLAGAELRLRIGARALVALGRERRLGEESEGSTKGGGEGRGG